MNSIQLLGFLAVGMAVALGLLIPMLWSMWVTGGWGIRPSFYDWDWPGDVFEDAVRSGMTRKQARAYFKQRTGL